MHKDARADFVIVRLILDYTSSNFIFFKAENISLYVFYLLSNEK